MIQPQGSAAFQVYCDFDGTYGWTILQRRQEPGTENFFRNWESYKTGFGNVGKGEHWLGNEKIFAITNLNPGRYRLRVDLEDWDNRFYSAEYSLFRISNEESNYMLNLGGYIDSTAGDSFSAHNRLFFTTRDRDNDEYEGGNCAQRSGGAWWYKRCYTSNLNGRYRGNQENKGRYPDMDDGVQWNSVFGNGTRYSMKSTEMKIRRT